MAPGTAKRPIVGDKAADIRMIRRLMAVGKLLWWSLLCGLPLLAHASGEKPVQVLTSIRPLALLVQDVAGDLAEVEILLPSGASPHHYSLRISDMRRVDGADMVVWVGPDFERFLTGTLNHESADCASLPLAELAGLHWPPAVSSADVDHAGRDMHIWLNPANGAVIMDAVAECLAQLRPAAADRIATRLTHAKARLAGLDAQLAETLTPLAQRGFGVSHDALGHFVAHYGLNQVGAVSAMPDQALSARHIGEIIRKMESAHCVLVESAEPPAARARLERLLGVPAVAADILAVNPGIESYTALIGQLGQSFAECLRQARGKGFPAD